MVIKFIYLNTMYQAEFVILLWLEYCAIQDIHQMGCG